MHLLGAVDHRLEIGLKLEELAVIRIKLQQKRMQQPVTDQHDADVQGDRVRFKRNGRDQAHPLGHGGDRDLAAFQASFQRVPGERFGQHLPDIENEIAAVGPVQRAGSDHGEIGEQCAHLADMLDPSGQVVVGRQVFLDHGRAVTILLRDHDIDDVAVELGFRVVFAHGFGKGAFGFPHGGVQEKTGIGDHVLPDVDQIVRDRLYLRECLNVRECGAKLAHAGGHDALCGAGVQILDFLSALPFQFRRFAQDIGEFLLKPDDLFVDGLLLVFVQIPVLVGFDDFSISDRGQHEPHGRTHQRHVFGGGPFGEIIHRFLMFAAVFFLDRTAGRLVFLGFKKRGNFGGKIVDKRFHLAFQPRRGARRHPQTAWFLGGVEVVHIGPVIWPRPRFCLLADQTPDGTVAAHSRIAQNVKIEFAVTDAAGQPDRVGGAVLPDKGVVILQFGGRAERKAGRIDSPFQRLVREPSIFVAFRRHHSSPLILQG